MRVLVSAAALSRITNGTWERDEEARILTVDHSKGRLKVRLTSTGTPLVVREQDVRLAP
jgi:transcription antitermination factor NusG